MKRRTHDGWIATVAKGGLSLDWHPKDGQRHHGVRVRIEGGRDSIQKRLLIQELARRINGERQPGSVEGQAHEVMAEIREHGAAIGAIKRAALKV